FESVLFSRTSRQPDMRSSTTIDYSLLVKGVTNPTAAHINSGAVGVAGLQQGIFELIDAVRRRNVASTTTSSSTRRAEDRSSCTPQSWTATPETVTT
ncbi:MAG TPA: CHRD domain-containing protein, partial [Thermoanaerobaculia bacterium]|nr:CHRD domain-containing protein [Thermoanaerobaculia bacterium]